MREYSASRFQYRIQEGKTLMSGGRLLQQYAVDGYSCIQDYRLRWIRNNQNYKKGLQDALTKGDTSGASTGQRIFIPSSFTAQDIWWKIFMMQWQYANGSANLIYSEHSHAIQNSPKSKIAYKKREWNQKIYLILSRRVFKRKLEELMNDLRHGNLFGWVQAG